MKQMSRKEKLMHALRRLHEMHVLFPVFGVVLLAVVWTTAIYLIHVEGAAAVRAASESSQELAETYEAQMAANLRSINQTLSTVKYAYERNRSRLVLSELKEQGLLPSSLLFAISITDRNGKLVSSTHAGARRDIAGEPEFELHRQGSTSMPVVNLGTGGAEPSVMNLHFSHRLDARDGTFDGVVTLSVWPAYFTSAYERSRLGDFGVLALASQDGTFLARRTGEDVFSGDALGFAPAIFRAAVDAKVGEAMLNPWDKVRRYTQVRELYGFPLAVIVGLSEEEQLAGFRDNRRTYILQAVLASVLLVAVVNAIASLSWQLSKSRRRTRKDQETYYAASNASLDAFFVMRCMRDDRGVVVDFVLEDTNNAGADMFGRPRENLVGRTLCQAFPQYRDNGVLDIFVDVVETGTVHEQEWENHLPVPRAKWLYRQLVRVEDDGLVAIVRDITERKQAELLRIEQGRVLEMIATGTPLQDALESLMYLIESQIRGTKSSVLLVDKDGLHLRHGAAISLPAAYVEAIDGVRIGPCVGSCGTAAHRRESVVVADIDEDPLWADFRALAAEHGLRSCWSTPIFSQQGEVLGTFALYSHEVRRPDAVERQLVDMTARIAGIAIDRQRTEDRIRHMAHHDALTGLPNRTLLGDRIEQAILYAQRYNRQVTVAFIDLDQFKLINDSLGHSAGDLLLKTVARRVVGCVRSTDTVVRIGGDEFVIVLCDQPENVDAITPTLQNIIEVIGDPVDLAGQQLRVTCSMGLASYPVDGTEADTLLKNADAAMYRAKELGRNNYQFYTSEMNIKVQGKLTLQEGLRHAIARSEFFLVYQPQVDLRTGSIFGVEVLIRWQHPELGMVPPVNFIPLAEECGLIVPIGDWVLHSACTQNKAWQEAGLPSIVMSVNVSARQFKDRQLVSKVALALQESGLEARYLELELTESLIMQDLQQAIATMQELQAMGVRLSIDDFGTGYSSLSALKSFPIVRLKLDRSFVRDLPDHEDDKAIARAVISLGHKLNLKVLAEGVETEQQRTFLRDNGCDEMQGYYFCKPVPPNQIEKLFEEQKLAVT
jgi:diguanylate cyclase (GGDEF)-like protein